jgi:hypothetical protein
MLALCSPTSIILLLLEHATRFFQVRPLSCYIYVTPWPFGFYSFYPFPVSPRLEESRISSVSSLYILLLIRQLSAGQAGDRPPILRSHRYIATVHPVVFVTRLEQRRTKSSSLLSQHASHVARLLLGLEYPPYINHIPRFQTSKCLPQRLPVPTA